MLIHIRQLTKVYRMGDSVVRALAGIDMDIDSGEFVSITGASGSGKSTLMHLIGCLDRATSGEYRLDGAPVTRMHEKHLARVRNRQIGFVFQTFNLINRTSAIDNVAVPLIYGRARNTHKKAMEALEKVGLAQRAKHTPAEMSGGERQRVAIARAIVNDPSVILADEPTGNLDSRTGEQILRIFERLHETGATILLVTHEMSVAARAQRLIHMTDGLIDADLPVAEDLRKELLQSAVIGAHAESDLLGDTVRARAG